MFKQVSIVALAILFAAPIAPAQSIVTTYQGQLRSGGVPANGSHNFVFRLCSSAGPDDVLQSFPPAGTIAVDVADGLFTQELAFNADHFNGAQRWLEVEVEGATLTPRQELTATPYATHSARPWITGGSDISYTTGRVGIGTSLPQSKLHVGGQPGVDGIIFPDGTLQTTAAIGGGSIWALNGTNAYYSAGKVGIGRNNPPDPLSFANITGDKIDLFGDAGGTYGFGIQSALLQIHTNNSGADIALGYGVSTAFTERMRVKGNGNVGIGTSTPLSRLDIAATGDGASALRFGTERPWNFRQAYTGPGTALRLQPETGLKNFEITAVGGTNIATFIGDDANPRVGIGTTGPAGTLSVYAPAFGSLNMFNSGIGDFTFDGGPDGLFGFNHVGGVSGSTVFASNHGLLVRFANDGTVDIGGHLPLAQLSVVAGTVQTAIRGQGAGYGVYGTGGLYGVFSNGNLSASGTKSFRIDHPSDPENKYLLHYCAEAPEPLNVYSGTITTDAKGEAWVQLPAYFGAINKDFRYTLTVVDDSDSETFVQAKVAREIRDNRFKIRTSAATTKVSWEVKGTRNDLWMRQHGMPVEVAKSTSERGTYQHPELYGQPAEKGMDYRAEVALPAAIDSFTPAGQDHAIR